MYSQIDSNKRKSALLLIFFVAFLVALGFAYDYAYGNGTGGGIAVALLFSLGMTATSYFAGDKIALAASRAQAISKTDNPRLYNMIENLAITAGVPMPKVYVIPDQAINAFATGRKPELSSVAVTEGALSKLDNEELEGVLAHELSHVKNLDTRFLMLVIVLVGAVGILANMFWRIRFFGGASAREDSRESNVSTVLMIFGFILILLSPLIAELIKLAVSRRREFLADASGALLTRYPEGLARALEKIQTDALPLQSASEATAPLYFSNPLSSKTIGALFSTHPPIEERIKALRTMAG